MKSNKIKNNGERRFAILLESLNMDYIHQPKAIKIDRFTSYRSDFLIPIYDLYIEIISNRQALENNKRKYMYVTIKNKKLLILNPDGSFYNTRNKYLSDLAIKNYAIYKDYQGISSFLLFNPKYSKPAENYSWKQFQSICEMEGKATKVKIIELIEKYLSERKQQTNFSKKQLKIKPGENVLRQAEESRKLSPAVMEQIMAHGKKESAVEK